MEQTALHRSPGAFRLSTGPGTRRHQRTFQYRSHLEVHFAMYLKHAQSFDAKLVTFIFGSAGCAAPYTVSSFESAGPLTLIGPAAFCFNSESAAFSLTFRDERSRLDAPW